MENTIQKAINEISENPNFKRDGFYVDIRDNGTIVLQCFPAEGEFSKKLSLDDSEQILKLLRIITEE
jgi:hypothetical protein